MTDHKSSVFGVRPYLCNGVLVYLVDKLTHSNRHIKHKHLDLREETHTLKKQNRLPITLLAACLLHIHQVEASTPDSCVNHSRVFPLKEVMQNGGSSLLSHILVDTNCRKVGARLEEKEKDALCFHHTHLYQV